MRSLLFAFLLLGAWGVRAQTPEQQPPAALVSQEAPAENAPQVDSCLLREPSPEEDASEDVEVMPTFNGGGLPSFRQWVMRQIIYPQELMSEGVRGKVILEFVVGADGLVSDVSLTFSSHMRFSAEVMRVFRSKIPAWKPGTLNGKPVPVRYTLPIEFRVR